MKKIMRWKFLREGLKSEANNFQWKLGKWEKIKGKLDMCQKGFHCSKEPYHTFSFIQGELLARVECRGKSIIDKDKECWQEQKIVKVYEWTKKDSVKLAIFSAKLCLKNFEKEFPKDKRPREAIEAARKWLKDPSEKNRSAARSAAWSAAGSAAWSAAWSVAESAAESAAWSAAESAESAAWSAAWSAGSAAWSAAESAARSAAVIDKIIIYFNKLVKQIIRRET